VALTQARRSATSHRPGGARLQTSLITQRLCALAGALMLSAQLPGSWGSGGAVRLMLLGSVALVGTAFLLERQQGDAQPWPHGDVIVLGLFVCGTVGLSVAIIQQNPALQVFGDLARIVASILAFNLGRRYGSAEALRVCRETAVLLILLDLALLCAYAYYLLRGDFDRLTGGSVPAFVFISAGLLSSPTPDWAAQRHRIKWIFAAGATATATLLSLTRGYWIIGCLVALAAARGTSGHRVKPKLKLFATLLVSCYAMAQYEPVWSRVQSRLRTITESEGFDDISSGRASESREVIDAFAESRLSREIFGFGLGGQRPTGEGELSHQIHSTALSIYFRHGILGCVVLTLPVLVLTAAALRTLWRSNSGEPINIFSAIIVFSMILGQSVYNVIGSPVFWLAAGAWHAENKLLRTQRSTPTSVVAQRPTVSGSSLRRPKLLHTLDP